MKKQIILALAMSVVSAVGFAANDSASDANKDATQPKGSYDSTPPATGDKGLGAYNGSTGEKAPEAGSGATGSASTGASGTGGSGASASGSVDASGNSSAGSVGAAGTGEASGAYGTTGGSTSASVSGSSQAFTTLDKNSDGQISKSEAKKDKSLSKQFNQLDSDKDGKLTQTEYQAMTTSGSGATGSSSESGDASGLKTDPKAGSANEGVTDMGGANSGTGNNIR